MQDRTGSSSTYNSLRVSFNCWSWCCCQVFAQHFEKDYPPCLSTWQRAVAKIDPWTLRWILGGNVMRLLINRADGTMWHSPRIRTIRTILAFSIISTCGWNRYQMDKTQVLATASWAGIWSSISGRITRQSCKCGSSHRCPDLPHPFSFSWHDLQLQLLNSLHVFSQALLDHFLWRETYAFRWIFFVPVWYTRFRFLSMNTMKGGETWTLVLVSVSTAARFVAARLE